MEILVCQDEAHEAQTVVKKIRELYLAQPESERRYDRIAVLYRAHHHRGALVEFLRKSEIPFHVQGGAALFEQSEIKELVAFLRALADPEDSVSLFRLLSHPTWQIPSDDLAVLSRLAHARGVGLRRILPEAPALALSGASATAVAQLSAQLDRFSAEASRVKVGPLVLRVVEESFLRLPMISLGRFLSLLYRYQELHPQAQDLASFLWYLDSLMAAGGDGASEEDPPAGDQVRLMTIHQAKGLEFDWVILLRMIQGRFPARGRPDPLAFPAGLMKEALPQGDHHLQEERRLCYVGLTRARRGLAVTTQERLYHRPSVFLQEMRQGVAPEGIRWIPAPAVAQEPAQDREGPPRPSPGAFPLPTTLSFTQLETYRTCPLKYQYSYLYQIPTPPTPQMNFGIDLHQCLEQLFREASKGGVPPLPQWLESFRKLHVPGRYGEPYQDEEYRRLGEELLAGFYRRQEGRFDPPLFVEKAFTMRFQDFFIRGVIDRVDPCPEGGVEIIDYKSGKSKQEMGQEEQLQLRLYALACQEVFGLVPKRISFYYLRTHEKLSFEHRPEDQEKAKLQIEEILTQIRSGDFSPSPSPPKCRRCGFKNLCPASMA